MMGGAILLLMYGLCAIGAGLNLPAWTRLAWLRWHAAERVRPWWRDTLFLARTGITLLAFGACGLAGLRTLASLAGEQRLEVPSPLGLIFIAAMALAEPFFLWIDELHKRAAGRHSLLWRVYLATGALWTTAVLAIVVLP